MADVVMGAMANLIPKLAKLAKEEYDLQVGTKERIDSLTMELEGAQAALREVAQVPWDKLDEQVKLWAREVRESSYDMEDVLDYYLVNVQGRDSVEKESLRKRLAKKMTNLFKKSKLRHKVNDDVTSVMTRLDEVTKRFHRFKVHDIVAKATTTADVDPRLAAIYNKVKDLVGINKSSGELISMLQTQQQGDVTSTKIKIISVVGVGGLGKTTLTKAVYDNLKGGFHRVAFVSVGRNPDLKKVIKRILIELDKDKYLNFNFTVLDEIDQFINELRDYLLEKENKRYFIVIDDMWEVESWETIKFAFDDDNNCGARIIVTTRKVEVATKASEVYKLQPLSNNSSRELLHTRMFGGQRGHVDNQPDEISNKILKKCGGIPLAIITMASLLVGKLREKWLEIYKTIGFEHKDCKEVENTMRILSFSYYDLPSHLRTCLLYLSAFSEDYVIPKASLIWKWVAEGFVHEEEGMWLFEIGEGYFNDLINKSLIQAVVEEDNNVNFYGTIVGCRVHDIVLDFIRSMSCKENFLTILDNEQDTLLQNHVRRLAQHNRIMQHSHHGNRLDDMRIVRTFSAQGCAVESWAPLSSFTVFRVLAIEGCKLTDGCHIRMENVGHLLHLRYLSLAETHINRIPEEIGGLRFLQTLNLFRSGIIETPTSRSLPARLACLHIAFVDYHHTGAEVAWVERLTSLEELLINSRFQWKELAAQPEGAQGAHC